MKSIEGVEIMAAGTWPASETMTIGESDLDSIVESFNFLGLSMRVPLKLGHDGTDERETSPERQFAMGWVKNIYREGKRLLADFMVPDKVFEILKEEYLKYVSVELYRDVQVANRQIPWMLDAIALLGSDQPAVGVLRALQKSLMSRGIPFAASLKHRKLNAGRHLTWTRANQFTRENEMTPAEIEALINSKSGTLIEAALKPFKDQLAKSEADLAAAQKATRDATVKANRTLIDELFNVAIESKTMEPKVREQFTKLTKYTSDDAYCEKVTLQEVKDYIKENSKAPVAASRTTGDGGTGAAADESGKTVSSIVRDRATKLMASLNQMNDANSTDNRVQQRYYANRRAAVAQVLRADSKLAELYKNATEEQEDAA